MSELYHETIALPLLPGARELALLEARLRKLPGVVSACIRDNGSLSLYFRDRRVLAGVGRILGGLRTALPAKTSRNNAVPVQQSAAAPNPEEEARACRFNAIVSLGGFAALALMKRFFPGFFLNLSIFRSAFVLYIARGIFKNGVLGLLRERSLNADTLTATAVTASLLAGKPESSLSLLVLSNFAEMLSLSAAEKARRHISHLLSMKEKYVWKKINGSVSKVRIEDVRVDDLVVVYLGEKISVDGVVVSGMAAVDQSSLTGEYVPSFKEAGEPVYAGTVVQSGQLVIKAAKVGDDTNLARIISMVECAQNRRAPVQNFADRMANMLVPISFIAAALVYAVTRDAQRVLNMFFIDYSCGLRLSTATAISAAISRAAQMGVLVKGGNYIENLSDVDTVVFDKTGTITDGHPEVTGIVTAPGAAPDELASLAAAAERNSSHPLAESVLNYAEKQGIRVPEPSAAEVVVGRGIRADIPDEAAGRERRVLVGSMVFMEESGVTGFDLIKVPEGAWNVFYVSRDGQALGAVIISDPIRKDLKRSINRLRRDGIDEILMLTGDSRQNAEAVTRELDLDGCESNMLPQDKADFIARKQIGSRVLMVGDGINDAPALAYADIGVAMGGKSADIALESADITITSDDPLKLPEVLNLSRSAMDLIRQNFAVTIAVNSAALLLGALGKINPLLAATIHNAATIGVVLNSSRLLFWNKRHLQEPAKSGSDPAGSAITSASTSEIGDNSHVQ